MSKLYNHILPRASQHIHRNINEVHASQMGTGDRVADMVASFIGSWRFIIGQACIMAVWVLVNTLVWFHVLRFDQYPFVFLNLAMSAEAAFSAPIIMMSQNRQAAKDRLQADEDYHTNVKAEHEVLQVLSHLDAQDVEILKIVGNIEKMMEKSL